MKRILTIIAILTIGAFNLIAQSSQIVHTVQRGETLTSIANTYGVTEKQIIEANPDAAQFIYVGMELMIPETDKTITVPSALLEENNINNNGSKYTPETTKSFSNEDDDNKLEFEFFAGMPISKYVGKDAKDFKDRLGFHFGILARYYLYNNLFADFSLSFTQKGYKKNVTESSGQYWNDEGPNYDSKTTTTMTTYNTDIPINIGYRINISDELNLKVKVGPYFTYALWGERIDKGYFSYSPDIHSSEIDRFNNKTKIGKDSLKDFQRFGIGLSGGIEVNYSHFFISIVYQRGFTKLIKEQKKFENNIIVALGYQF